MKNRIRAPRRGALAPLAGCALGAIVPAAQAQAPAWPSWVALAAPAATPKAVQQRIADEVRAAVRLPEVRARIESFGFDPVALGPAEFAAVYRKDLAVWERLVRQSGATLD